MGKQDPGELILPEEAHKDWGGVPEHSLQHCYNQEKETTQSPIKSKMDRFLLILRTDQVEPCPTELWQSGGMTAWIVLTKVRHRAHVYGPTYVNTGRADLCCPTWIGGVLSLDLIAGPRASSVGKRSSSWKLTTWTPFCQSFFTYEKFLEK